MIDAVESAERWWAVGVGISGLVAFAGGWLLLALPRIDADNDAVIAYLVKRRHPILIGAVLAVGGGGLLLWPLTAVTSAAGGSAWMSLGPFSIAAWAVAFAFSSLAAIIPAGLVWRDPTIVATSSVRLLLDISHLAIWSVSAPLGIVGVVTTSAIGRQAGFFGPWVVVAASAKVATALVEIVGTGRRKGWNAGGWAGGSSGYATVVWFATVLASLPTHA